jgi:hypothetical protein
MGKPLVVFVAQEQRENFYQQLTQLQHGEQVQQRWMLRLLPRNLPPVSVTLATVNVSDWQGNLVGLRVCLRNISNGDCEFQSSQLAQTATPEDRFNLIGHRPKQTYFGVA